MDKEIKEKQFDKYLYRYTGHSFSHGGFDIRGEYKHSYSSYKVLLSEYGIIKETAKGFCKYGRNIFSFKETS